MNEEQTLNVGYYRRPKAMLRLRAIKFLLFVYTSTYLFLNSVPVQVDSVLAVGKPIHSVCVPESVIFLFRCQVSV